MFSPGDFVLHSRQGPSRILEVLPDQIVLKRRRGETFRVNRAVADHELKPVPADGFVALLYQRDMNSTFLLDNIEDVVCRILRDYRRQTITAQELKAELEPHLLRDGPKWKTWWKNARKRLVSSKTIQVDPKHKNNVALRQDANDLIPRLLVRARQARSSSELLQAAREVSGISENDEVKTAVTELAKAVIREFTSAVVGDRATAELFFSACYLFENLKSEQRNTLSDFIKTKQLNGFPLIRELDEDLLVCLGRLVRISPTKAAELASSCLSHPSAAIAKQAFLQLNQDKFRGLLKERLLQCITSIPNKHRILTQNRMERANCIVMTANGKM